MNFTLKRFNEYVTYELPTNAVFIHKFSDHCHLVSVIEGTKMKHYNYSMHYNGFKKRLRSRFDWEYDIEMEHTKEIVFKRSDDPRVKSYIQKHPERFI